MVKVLLVGELFMIFFSVSKYAAAICRLLKWVLWDTKVYDTGL